MWRSGFRCITKTGKKIAQSKQGAPPHTKQLSLSRTGPVPDFSALLFSLPHLFIFPILVLKCSPFLLGCLGTHENDRHYQRHSDFPSCLSSSESGSGHQRNGVRVQKSCNLSPPFTSPVTEQAGWVSRARLCRVSL